MLLLNKPSLSDPHRSVIEGNYSAQFVGNVRYGPITDLACLARNERGRQLRRPLRFKEQGLVGCQARKAQAGLAVQ